MSTRQLEWLALLVAVVAVGTGIGLLLLSGWFIAASALAGIGALGTFNYLLPAASIRMLAISRIAAGYGEKALGHAALLCRVQALRERIFVTLVGQPRAEDERAEQLDRLAHDVDVVGNRWLAVVLPAAGSAAVALLALLVVAQWTPAALGYLLAVILFGLVLVLLQYRLARQLTVQARQLAPIWRTRLEATLRAAPLWPLFKQAPFAPNSALAGEQDSILYRQRLRDGRTEALLLAAVGVMIVALLLFADIAWAAWVMLPLMALLSVGDWFTPALQAGATQAATQVSRGQLAPLRADRTPHSASFEPVPGKAHRLVSSIQLKDFQWQLAQRSGAVLNQQLQQGQLVWLKGSSGSGKSSTLLAMAGVLPYRGSLAIDDQWHQHADRQDVEPHLHYVEQFPYLLSATLRDNLTLAQPDASDADLRQALQQAQLAGLENALDQWVGECGRALSGGEMKRLGVARALLFDAPVWLLDEPFEGVDAPSAAALLELLQQQTETRIIIVASHIWPQGIDADLVIDLDQALS